MINIDKDISNNYQKRHEESLKYCFQFHMESIHIDIIESTGPKGPIDD